MKLFVFGCFVLFAITFGTVYSENVRSLQKQPPESQSENVRTLQKQCVDQGFAGVCSISTRQDDKERCYTPLQCAVVVGREKYKQPGGRVPDGTRCGKASESKVCRNKKCVATDTLPKYVGDTTAITCKKQVPTSDKITPKPLEPLSP